MNLAEKYRPQTFGGMLGNLDTINYLKTWRKKFRKGDETPHAFILIGDTGCGKTTAARILAKNILGEEWNESPDYVEINSANFRGIDTAREVARLSTCTPLSGDNRLIFLDEIHKATNDAQTALLKPIEEAQDHCYFLLATTEANKVLRPLFNRCTPLYFSPLDKDGTRALIDKVLQAENKEVEYDLEKIYNLTGGRCREIYQFLEKLVDNCGESLYNLEYGENESDSPEIELCRTLLRANAKWSDITAIASKITDFERCRHVLLSYNTKVLLGGRFNVTSALVLEVFDTITGTQVDFVRKLSLCWAQRGSK